MYLIQIFLPVHDNDGNRFPRALLDPVREDLTEQFGGTTAFLRSPAVGAWEDDDGEVCRDDVVLLEVMSDAVEHGWWSRYRRDLEQRFGQEEILVRASALERL